MEGIIIVMFLERQNAQHLCIAASRQAGGHRYYEFVANVFGFLAVDHSLWHCWMTHVCLGSVSEHWLSSVVLNNVLEGMGEMLLTVKPHNSHARKFHLITTDNNNWHLLSAYYIPGTAYYLTESWQKPCEASCNHKALAIATAAIWPLHVVLLGGRTEAPENWPE